MGLYLCVFDGDDEVDGLEVGSYADYGNLVKHVVEKLEGGVGGSRFPVFVLHSDCDGSWTPEECAVLEKEICIIVAEFKQHEAIPFSSDWQFKIAKQMGHCPQNLYESFIDVDGELLLDRLLELARVAQHRDEPIVFQ
jgi:hypothetical protein